MGLYDTTNKRPFELIENYIYFYHTQKMLILPTYPDSISDSMAANFAQSTPLSRTAPIYSYTSSGPRSLQITMKFHRDMMQQVNYEKNKLLNIEGLGSNDDYVDTLINELQSAALPRYADASKMVDPPIIAIRFGNSIYCKGVATSGISLTYDLPIIDNKYAVVGVNFTIQEIDPYDADTVALAGSFRGLDTSLERKMLGRTI